MLKIIFHFSMLPSTIIDAQERREVISYLWERETDEARSIANRRPITIGTCHAIVISTLWQTTETFPTPGDTIVLNVTQRQEMSFQRLISSYESLRSRHFPVDSFSHLMYIVETRDFFSIQTTRRCLNDVSNVVEEEVAAEVHRSLQKRHTSTFLRTSQEN